MRGTMTLVAAMLGVAMAAGSVGLSARALRPDAGPARPSWQMPFVLQDNLVRLDANVDGHVRSAVLDSGTGALLLDTGAARTLGLRARATGIVASGAGAAVQAVRAIEIDRLAFGSFVFPRAHAYAADLSHLSKSAGFPIDVLLGAPIFMRGAVTVDYPRRRLTFGPGGAADRCPSPIPFVLVNGVPVVSVLLRASRTGPPVVLKMMVDLGTRHAAMMIGGRFLHTQDGAALLRAGRRGQLGTGIGGRVDGAVARVPGLSIGGTELGPQDVSLVESGWTVPGGLFDGTLGVPLWIGGRISFDYPARRLCLVLPRSHDGTG